MTGELWWTRMINAVRFLDDITDSLISGKSVALNFLNEIPWADDMTEMLWQKLEKTSDYTFDIHDVASVKKPGDYLFRKYFSKQEQSKFWEPTHRTYERFMAANTNTPLNHRYVCAKNITSLNASDWMKSVSEYLEYCNDEKEHGKFILITEKANIRSSEYIDCYNYEDYVTDYDCLMLCLTKISSLKCSSVQKQYISEVASNIANNNVEIAGKLVSFETELIKNPISVTKNILDDEMGLEKKPEIETNVNKAVWQAQVKIIFPKLEDFRRNTIQKYRNRIKKYFPFKSSTGERIDNPDELEIGQLYKIFKDNNIAEYSELKLLGNMRDARNNLAHCKPISYSKLTELKFL